MIEKEHKIINAKHFLTLKEAALLLNISSPTLRGSTLTQQILTSNSGKKWIFD